jgi:hypothetical protein
VQVNGVRVQKFLNVALPSLPAVLCLQFVAELKEEADMRRERVLKVVLILVGLLFTAAVYPLILMARQDPALAMMMSLYVTLGIFLLLAARNPSEHRSLIAFAAWSSLAHASLMSVQCFLKLIARSERIGVAVFAVIGVILIVLAPAKRSVDRMPAAVA